MDLYQWYLQRQELANMTAFAFFCYLAMIFTIAKLPQRFFEKQDDD